MRNYLVIGGTSGIGEEIVRILSGSRQRVIVASRGQREFSPLPGVSYQTFDATFDTDEGFSVPESLDGLVYAPGSINLKPFGRLGSEDFIHDFKINVTGAVNVIQKTLPSLQKGISPSVVLFSTVAVTRGMPFHASISAAKGAVEGLTRSLAAEFAPHIRVNAIAPSLTQTPLAERLLNTEARMEASAQRHPLKRIGKPADIARIACFLLSEDAGWITGQVIHVDGGMSTVG